MIGPELLGVALLVAFGAVVPVVPTGAAVSAAAVLTRADRPWEILLVVAAGAAGAYVGDVIVYAGLRFFGEPLAQRMGWLNREDPQGAVQRMRERIEQHELRTLLVSRLVPGGRVPVLIAAALGGYPLRKFASAAVAAAVLWSTLYTAIGVLGATVFPDNSFSVAGVVIVALLVGLVVPAAQRWRGRAVRGRPSGSV